jgi:hypothetical protein
LAASLASETASLASSTALPAASLASETALSAVALASAAASLTSETACSAAPLASEAAASTVEAAFSAAVFTSEATAEAASWVSFFASCVHAAKPATIIAAINNFFMLYILWSKKYLSKLTDQKIIT